MIYNFSKRLQVRRVKSCGLFFKLVGDNILENWFRCPRCNKPLLKLTERSVVRNEIYCRCCKTSFDVDITGTEVKSAAEVKKRTA